MARGDMELRRVFRRSTIGKFSRCMPLRILADLRDEVQAPKLPKAPKANTAPGRAVLAQWREAQAVCFDVDCTVTQQDSLDLLADFLGRGDQVAHLTDKVCIAP